jgi:hypothetical protein
VKNKKIRILDFLVKKCYQRCLIAGIWWNAVPHQVFVRRRKLGGSELETISKEVKLVTIIREKILK